VADDGKERGEDGVDGMTTVAAASLFSTAPHCEQNRLSPEMPVPQAGQDGMNDYSHTPRNSSGAGPLKLSGPAGPFR